MNGIGVIDLDDLSDSDEDVPSQPALKTDEKFDDTKIDFKKEETTEEKIIADDIIMNSNADSSTLYSNDEDEWSFDDKLPHNFMDDENISAKPDKTVIGTKQNNNENSENEESCNDAPVQQDAKENHVDKKEEKSNLGDAESDAVADLDDVSTPKASTSPESNRSEVNAETEEHTVESKILKEAEIDERETTTSKDSEDENEKNADTKDKETDNESIENERPSSRQSITSTTSSSSERLTIRTPSKVNELPSLIKSEKESSDKIEKPVISVVNPSQLVASDNNFVQSGDQMMGFLPSGIPNEPVQGIANFSAHQQVVNQSPVEQLAHQVRSLPPVSNYAPVRQYTSAPRIGGVRSVISPQPNPLKRGVSSLQSPRQFTPIKRRCLDNYSTRNGDFDCKVVSVQKPDNTDDVVAQLSKSITMSARRDAEKKNDTAAVANVLASRGITVSAVSTNANKNSNAVAMLNLNSAVSLIPTTNNNNQSRQNSGFAVPQGRIGGGRQSGVSQTVDLTGPELPKNRPLNKTNKFTCRVCDRRFFNQDHLNQHMTIHRSGVKKQLPFKCNNCAALYPTQQALMQHRQTCRREIVSGTNEMVIPVVDLKQPGIVQRLQANGIHHMIPLNALGNQSSNGTLGVPILAFSSDRATTTNMANMGISNIIPFGPLRRL